eukprot:NODE_6108_length_372_cov_3.934985_g5389_i0.p2 GENE.NODE_6108_length_372_cov_3.934985_g5389_i0~~NODE_6108_length_372_cov_3.934985_g5389_i0.p2  ORF type:complete len:99 (+),score=9.38 NODE_6108_length_372_cov_3.934985_g5389_i0:54-350(+)
MMDTYKCPSSHTVYRLNFLIFLVLFLVVRLLSPPLLLVQFLRFKGLDGVPWWNAYLYMQWKCIVGSCIVQLLNIYWFALNCRKAHRLLFQQPDKGKRA